MAFKELLKKIDLYRDRIVEHRPLTPDEVRELDNYYKIGTTYSSNALEGNSLTITETKVILEDGITIGGKPIKDCYEATGHGKSYDFMLETARFENFIFSEEVIKKLHLLFYSGIDINRAGQYRDHQVLITGSEYIPPEAEAVPKLMKQLVKELNSKKGSLHPVELAAYAHRKLVDIHPFTDGNGRTARLLMNLILVNKGYPLITIAPVLRTDYIQALMAAQRENSPTDEPFMTFIAECELEAQRDYCRMFHIPLKIE